MMRRVVSILSSPVGGLRSTEPAIDANAYAVAEDVELTLVLEGQAVELALTGGEVGPGELAGVALPPSASAQELRGLLESGVAVHAAAADMARLGVTEADLATGVTSASPETVGRLLRGSDAVLRW